MGKLSFEFYWSEGYLDGQSLYGHTSILDSQIRSMYNLDILSQVEIEGADQVIRIDLSKAKDVDVDWNVLLPDDRTKEIVKDLYLYQTTLYKIENIQRSINAARFEDSYELKTLGEDLIRLANQFRKSKYFESYFDVEHFIKDVTHTLDQEIRMLGKYKERDSKKSKEAALRTAKHNLYTDSISFESALKGVKLSQP